ncbi:hypothetical protein GCM10010994_44610 [Chelatococcus reniformis]|uniref:Uncharacterized protein n=1 Tax=Chelatococcus reniformis TaxID=1494448 RepID=A0A916UP86_9HYPH|nr:hypothetical protein GCM10010994_44610 [Chelatococcus reniformis]
MAAVFQAPPPPTQVFITISLPQPRDARLEPGLCALHHQTRAWKQGSDGGPQGYEKMAPPHFASGASLGRKRRSRAPLSGLSDAPEREKDGHRHAVSSEA